MSVSRTDPPSALSSVKILRRPSLVAAAIEILLEVIYKVNRQPQ